MSKSKEVLRELNNHAHQVIVDNDFEHAFNMPFEAFKDFDREDLIEALFVLQAINEEMNSTVDMMMGRGQ